MGIRGELGKISGTVLEAAVEKFSLSAPCSARPENPRNIFVLRNNDLGDLLIITPLFEALKKRFPAAKITVGTGDWAREILQNNPYVSQVMPVNAPWFNKAMKKNFLSPLFYLRKSPEIKNLRDKKFDIGIDVLGSGYGALLLMKAGIPYRLGVRGYAGGHTAMQWCVDFNPLEQVGRSSLRFAEHLGAVVIPEKRPQIFLTEQEKRGGEETWEKITKGKNVKRVLIGPGGGLKVKGWPADSYEELVRLMNALPDLKIAAVGNSEDRETGEKLAKAGAENLAGNLTLRQTFALTASADYVISNPSMLMHAAAAFKKPTLVLLGPAFESESRHFAQWGYSGECYHLGLEKGRRDTLYTPAEVMSVIEEKFFSRTETGKKS